MTSATTPITATGDPGDAAPSDAPSDAAADLRRAAARATRAPSVHNTQPWRFELGPTALELSADSSRQLPVIDPDGRQMTISCGCALLGARLSLQARGVPVEVSLLPDPSRPEHLAHIELLGAATGRDPAATALDQAADERHSNRRRFGHDDVPADLLSQLTAAAQAEGAQLDEIRTGAHRALFAALTQEADAALLADPAYRGELRDWTGGRRQDGDGIPDASMPDAGRVEDSLPVRAFDQRGTGRLPANPRAESGGSLFVLCTENDDPLGWLAAGQALYRVLLELTPMRLVAGLFTQFTEVPRIRRQVGTVLSLVGQPQVALHIGYATRTEPTPRRAIPDVIDPAPDGPTAR